MNSHLPKWVSTDKFDIEARAPGNPAKDQMRLMMKALLAERFQLAVHFETDEIPELAMTLVKPGKTGPGLRPHAEGPSCDKPPSPELFPPFCDAMPMMIEGGQRRGGGRNITPAMIAWRLPSLGNLDRPGIDRTGLTGTFDFTIKWTPGPTPLGATRTIPKKGPAGNAPAPAPNAEPDAEGPAEAPELICRRVFRTIHHTTGLPSVLARPKKRYTRPRSRLSVACETRPGSRVPPAPNSPAI